jgi:hypothetical protein
MKLSVQHMRGVLWSMTIGMALLFAGCGSGTGGTPSGSTPTADIGTVLTDVENLPVDPLLNVVFDTVMDPASINENTVYLVSDATDEMVEGTVTLLDDGVTAVLTIVDKLPTGDYTLVITDQVRDLAGHHPVSNLLAPVQVGDIARMAVPVVWPVAEIVLSNEAVQLLTSTLSSLLGSTGGLPSLSGADLTNLKDLGGMSINDLLAAVLALNPAAETVDDLLNTELSLEQALTILKETLPEESAPLIDVIDGIIGDLAVAPGELLGQSITLNQVLTLPAELLGVDVLSMPAEELLATALNPLALLEAIAEAVNAGAVVNDSVFGEIVASVVGPTGLSLDGLGNLTQIPGGTVLSSLIPVDLLDLVNTILDTEDPVSVINTLLGGTLIDDILGGALGGTDLLDTLTGLLGADLAGTLTGLLDGLTTDPTGTLERLLGLLGALSL